MEQTELEYELGELEKAMESYNRSLEALLLIENE